MNHISIIISTRNAKNYIDKCVQSALSQDYEDFNVIFIDAKSEDGTFEIAKKYELIDNRIFVIQNKERKFQGENRKPEMAVQQH